MNIQSRFFSSVICLALAGALVTLGGCGKAGMPSPRSSKETFDFAQTQASAAGKCITVQGVVTGAVNNVDRIDLEISAIKDGADCPGCPFNALEYGEFSSGDLSFDDAGAFVLSYCPAESAGAYRWRLVGRNSFSGLPYSMTNPAIVVMP